MWSDNPAVRAEQERREIRLKSDENYWGLLIRKGARAMRYAGDHQSAIRILSSLVQLPEVVLDIQKEIIHEKKIVEETHAGRFLLQDIIKKEEEYRKKLEEMCKEVLKEKDAELAAVMRRQARMHGEKLKRAVAGKGILAEDISMQIEAGKLEIQRLRAQIKIIMWAVGACSGIIVGLGIWNSFAPAVLPAAGAAFAAADIPLILSNIASTVGTSVFASAIERLFHGH